MQLFFVICSDSDLDGIIKEHYPMHHYKFEGAWVVADNNKTTADICASLGIDGIGHRRGVVVQATMYHGWYGTELWEKMNMWMEE